MRPTRPVRPDDSTLLPRRSEAVIRRLTRHMPKRERGVQQHGVVSGSAGWRGRTSGSMGRGSVGTTTASVTLVACPADS